MAKSTRRSVSKSKGELLNGKMRRFFLGIFRPLYIKRQMALRRGACKRCGNCCAIAFSCPFLKTADGITACAIYGFRPSQCALFPIDERDLAEIPKGCGFYFKAGKKRV